MKVRVLYFARLRERFGVAEETVECGTSTAGGLIAELQARGGAWVEELGSGRAFRVAVDQTIVPLDAPIRDGDEVAIFPPVTGG